MQFDVNLPRCKRHRRGQNESHQDWYWRMQFDKTASHCIRCRAPARRSRRKPIIIINLIWLAYFIWLITENFKEIASWFR